jgi:hypothetical protein
MAHAPGSPLVNPPSFWLYARPHNASASVFSNARLNLRGSTAVHHPAVRNDSIKAIAGPLTKGDMLHSGYRLNALHFTM